MISITDSSDKDKHLNPFFKRTRFEWKNVEVGGCVVVFEEDRGATSNLN